MATTISLNSSDSIVVNTFWGGERGLCYTIFLFIGDLQLQTTLTEEEFLEMVINYNNDVEVYKMAVKPSADNRGPIIQDVDPALEKLLDEEDEIARRTRLANWALGESRDTDWDRDHPRTSTERG